MWHLPSSWGQTNRRTLPKRFSTMHRRFWGVVFFWFPRLEGEWYKDPRTGLPLLTLILHIAFLSLRLKTASGPLLYDLFRHFSNCTKHVSSLFGADFLRKLTQAMVWCRLFATVIAWKRVSVLPSIQQEKIFWLKQLLVGVLKSTTFEVVVSPCHPIIAPAQKYTAEWGWCAEDGAIRRTQETQDSEKGCCDWLWWHAVRSIVCLVVVWSQRTTCCPRLEKLAGHMEHCHRPGRGVTIQLIGNLARGICFEYRT